MTATAETYVPLHGRSPDPPPAAPTAELLAELVNVAPPASAFPALAPAPPWVGWDHHEGALWPWPDDLMVDMNSTPGPDWVDCTAQRVRERLSRVRAEPVIGHIDWEAHNLDWNDAQPVVVHDWDSIAIRPDAAIAGAAAAVFPSNGANAVAATVEQTAEFLDTYRRARPRWSVDDDEIAWAAGLWVLTYNAKKEALGGGTGYLTHLEAEIDDRARLAGI